jgi:hypothetical protein
MNDFCNIIWLIDEVGVDHDEERSREYFKVWKKLTYDVSVETSTPMEEAIKE